MVERSQVAGRYAVVMTAAVLLAGVSPAYANPSDDSSGADLRAEQERIAQQVAEAQATMEHATERARQAAAEFAAAEAALPAAEARLGEARGRLVAAQVRAEAAQQQAEQAGRELAEATRRVTEASHGVDLARQHVASFAVAAYKGSRIAGFRLMLRADGPAEAAQRLGYLDHISGVERAGLDELGAARLRARQRENEAAVAYQRAEAARQEAAALLAAAAAAEAAAAEAAAAARELTDARAAALRDAEAEREESLRRYEEARASSARLAEQLRQWEAEQAARAREQAAAAESRARADRPGPVDRGGTVEPGFLMPTRGWISSAFGMRHDPVFRVWQMHDGMDIAAPGGAPVYAAASGVVSFAGWNGGYGNFTCLSHGTFQGRWLSTCYAHQSEILVSPGQRVAAGELIGRVGTTGASTGDHLHFEVRLDGTPSDPLRFLPDCLC